MTDDKIVHVFSVGADGKLAEQNQRVMPKRPCAIQILPDNATIICGDKFGDVYELPLMSTGPAAASNPEARAENVSQNVPAPGEDQTVFKPAATNLTVHTKRNRKALEAQMKQKEFTAKKEPLKFEHKVLLGHVSMLTDVVYAIREVGTKHRGYIVTADRDEHIRISRGPPQAHVTEGYCLGHKEYINKLCLIPGTDLLVSGGGDDELYVWDWPNFKLQRKHSLQAVVTAAIREAPKLMGPTAEEAAQKIAEKVSGTELNPTTGEVRSASVNVSGLWTAPFTTTKSKKETALIVACERVPALFIVPVSRLQLKQKIEITEWPLEHPPLDVTVAGDNVLVSLDCRTGEGYPLVQAYRLGQEADAGEGDVNMKQNSEMLEKLKCLVDMDAEGKTHDKALDELLYGVANLRKRRGFDALKVAPGDEDAEDASLGVGQVAAEAEE